MEEAVDEHLTYVRDVYREVVLEKRERVVVGAGAAAYLLRISYVEYAPDMESFPTGEIVLLTVTEDGQPLKVRYVCALRRCAFEDVSIRSVLKSMVPRNRHVRPDRTTCGGIPITVTKPDATGERQVSAAGNRQLNREATLGP
ncbi:hypothetical protein E1286_10890 [Nonomuraea terrae]|uniref:Uncharacterized protein n=1 Tax=Nonomuraea terrae TaxID=2530383 RepID=A0A4R4Z0E7_9ACTN|nr:hypothetical protein [Nonomuraea terrae]TDD51206.1 hypothetical protein E1286_10890 [Nonomuraea terrae]